MSATKPDFCANEPPLQIRPDSFLKKWSRIFDKNLLNLRFLHKNLLNLRLSAKMPFIFGNTHFISAKEPKEPYKNMSLFHQKRFLMNTSWDKRHTFRQKRHVKQTCLSMTMSQDILLSQDVFIKGLFWWKRDIFFLRLNGY